MQDYSTKDNNRKLILVSVISIILGFGVIMFTVPGQLPVNPVSNEKDSVGAVGKDTQQMSLAFSQRSSQACKPGCFSAIIFGSPGCYSLAAARKGRLQQCQ